MAKILLAEDDFAIRDFVRLALEMDHHDVVAVHNGDEALERIKADPDQYHLLLTDIRMPITDGIALVHALVEKNIELPILLMTGYSDHKDKALLGLTPSVKGLVVKPFTLELIREQVQSTLSNLNSEAA